MTGTVRAYGAVYKDAIFWFLLLTESFAIVINTEEKVRLQHEYLYGHLSMSEHPRFFL